MGGRETSDSELVVARRGRWISALAWICALILVATAFYLAWDKGLIPGSAAESQSSTTPLPVATITPLPEKILSEAELPDWSATDDPQTVTRIAEPFTKIPPRSRQEVLEYTVELGDSVFGIANAFDITPETVLWSNYDLLKDNPHALTAGMSLKIPPVDGVYYQWQENDTLESVAADFRTTPDSILDWGGNQIDLTDPQIQPDAWVMIPGGQREFQQWIVPIIARGSAGVSTGVYGAGACEGGYDGLYGTGGFIWPSVNHTLSGNDYWSGHLAIDIGSSLGEPIVASDSGVVVFAGWSTGGYGNTVAIDHGNGYQTLYGHLNSVNVSCGQSVSQGQVIAYAGSTGNSTGPHLHFEIRYQGGFVNPWYVLPAP